MEHVDSAIIRRFDTKSSRPCEFCKEFDPHFRNRQLVDQMVISTRRAVASSHITEDGYVRHRILELRKITSRVPVNAA